MKLIKYRKIIFGILAICIIITCLSAFYLLHKNRTKILLIGLDGATWNIINPLVKEGKMPNMKRLIDKGCSGNLESYPPLMSEIVWTSIVTGKSPDKHGITDRIVSDPDTGELIPVTSNLRNVKAIWNILSEYKKKVGVMGYLVTWPPEKINGVMISDRVKIDTYSAKDYSYPALENLCTKQDFESFSNIENGIFSRIEKDKFKYFDKIEEIKDTFKVNFSKYLLQKQSFDFFCLYIRNTDILSHYFWKYRVPENATILPEKDIERYKNIIDDYYVWCDKIIGEILKLIDKNTVVIIVSDHGFTTAKTKNSLIKIDPILSLIGLSKGVKNSKIFSMLSDEKNFWWRPNKYLEIKGDLSSEELEEIKKESKLALESIKIKETGEQIFKILNDTKMGFFIESDMQLINKNLENHILIGGKEYKLYDFLEPNPSSGDHKNLGVIIISGKNIGQNKKIDNATIYDITPTILYLMELPIGIDMKGKIIAEAIDTKFLEIRPVKYIETYETGHEEKNKKPIRSPADEKKMKELMRSLGYIN